MKSKLLIIALISLLYSCNLFRSTSPETKQKNNIKSETEIQKMADEKTDLKKNSIVETSTKTVHYATKDQVDKMIAEWNESLVTYDTSKPIDSITHKPPVLSERIINYKSDNQTKETTKENSTGYKKEKNNLKVDLSKQSKTKSNSISNITDKSKSESSNEEGTTNWKLWFGLGVGSVIAVWLWFKYGKSLLF